MDGEARTGVKKVPSRGNLKISVDRERGASLHVLQTCSENERSNCVTKFNELDSDHAAGLKLMSRERRMEIAPKKHTINGDVQGCVCHQFLPTKGFFITNQAEGNLWHPRLNVKHHHREYTAESAAALRMTGCSSLTADEKNTTRPTDSIQAANVSQEGGRYTSRT